MEFVWDTGKRFFFEAYLLEKDHPQLSSKSQGIWQHLLGKRDETRAAEFVNTCSTLLKGAGCSNHTGGTCSHSGMMDYPRFPTSEMHLGKFSDSMEFQSWKANFKTEVCSKISRSSSSHNALDQRS